MDAALATAVIGGFTALVVIFLKKDTADRKAQEKKDALDRARMAALTKAINTMAKATKEGSEKVAAAQDKTALEAEKRNGHLAEIAVENKQSNADQFKAILTAISNLPSQHVTNQTVDNLTVKKK